MVTLIIFSKPLAGIHVHVSLTHLTTHTSCVALGSHNHKPPVWCTPG